MIKTLEVAFHFTGGMGSIPGLGTKIPHAMVCQEKDTINIQKLRICFKNHGLLGKVAYYLKSL